MFPFRVFRRRRTTLAPNEVVEFYPSYGYRNSDSSGWRLVVQGGVYNPMLPWFRRRPVMAVIRQAMRVDRTADEFFRRRMQRFLLDSATGRQISIRIADEIFPAGESGLAGLFRHEVAVSDDLISNIVQNPDAVNPWIDFDACLVEGDDRLFAGRIQLVAPTGISIVSDVDDTVKYSNVPNRRDLFHNTFSRKFSPIDGMAALYRDCVERGAAFHFVSGSPWQLYEPLADFFREHDFPYGSYHLKTFRIRDTAKKIHGPVLQLTHKRAAIEPILRAFPQRKFVLIGDSGEQDPVIYGGVLRERPEQILGVLIRAARGETEIDDRLRSAFAGCNPEQWQLYHRTEEMRDRLMAWVEA